MELERIGLDVLSRLGLGQEALAVYDTVADLTGPDIDERIRAEADRPTDRGAVLFPMIPAYKSICYRYSILGHAFRTRGYRPLLVRDDGVLEASPERTVADDRPTPTEQCRYFGRRIPAKFGIEPIPLSSLLDDDYEPPAVDAVTDGQYRGVDVERFTEGSLRKYFKRYTIDETDPAVRPAHERYLRSGMTLVDAFERLFDRYDVTATVVHEPYYIQGGVPLAVSERHGVDGYSQMMGYQSETLIFGRTGNRSTLPAYARDDVVSRFLERPLTDDQRAELSKIMRNRRTGTDVKTQFSATTERSLDAAADALVGMFTNLLWDDSLGPETALYDDLHDWVLDTIDVLAGVEGVTLVVKTHPAEGMIGTNESVVGWIDDAYETLPENVEVLEPDTDVDTYELIDDLDAGVVYNSTVGMEMVYEGVPVVVGGETHYRGFGFTYDPETLDAYATRLRNVADLTMDEEMVRRARRYLHTFFVKRHVDFPYCYRADGLDHALRPVTHDELAPGAEPFESITRAILEGRTVLAPGYEEPPSPDPA